MGNDRLKKILAGLSIAGLLSGGGMTLPSFAASGCSGSASESASDERPAEASCSGSVSEEGQTSCSGSMSEDEGMDGETGEESADEGEAEEGQGSCSGNK